MLNLIIEKASHISRIKKIINNLSIGYDELNKAPYLAKKIFIDNWRSFLVVLLGFILTYSQILSVYFLTKSPLKTTILKDIIKVSSQQILLSTIIFYLFFILIFGILNRYWFAFIFSVSTFIIISIAEILKISLRDEPILPTDLSMLAAINQLLKMVNPVIIVATLMLIIILFASSFILEKKFKSIYNRNNWRKRITLILTPIIIFSGSFFINHNNSLPKIVFKAFGVQPLFYDQTGGARINGPIIQFLNNVDTKIMNKPTGYSKNNITNIMKKYDQSAKVMNKTRKNSLSNQTIIFNLSESFSDPNRVPNLKVTPNPISYLTKLKSQTLSGLMLSSGYGGGTANMEWQSLTGLSISNLSPTLPTPYTQLVPAQKVSPAFTDLFDSSVAIHPFNASLYNRINVFKKFGFNKFYYDGSKYKLSYKEKIGSSPYISDKAAYKNTIKIINQQHSGSRFIQLSTMQNHMPYTNYYPKAKKFKISGSAFNKDSKESIETYSQGLNYTDKSLKNFITKIDKIDEPITIVWYGDHLASLYNKDSMSKYGIQLHQTDYFIYNNQNHKLTRSSADKIISPYSFSALALKADNIKVSPYYALITKITEELPAMTIDPTSSQINSMNGSNIFVSGNGKKITASSLTRKQKQLLHDYRLIQYDLTAGKQYSARWAQQKIK
ncbi:LTA synthase family protein [Paucilactobacillus kaifaensis]|uniref:LTA synthase family protein n=1 Tax=Paucilactobacillus kaifaensis TaxID=2559921 RepID=UPI0010F454B3|nr:LTA synthase family protein [Paucilactobacillus kaifaensis]